MKPDKFITFNQPYISGRELPYIQEVFENEQFQGNGPFTVKCQQLLQEFLDSGPIFLTDSCTSALEMSAMLLRQSGDNEVILPSFTFTTTASAFARAGYKLVFAEVDPTTMMLDPEDVARKTTSNTRAIVPVHYAGYAADLDALTEIAKQTGAALVEDAAQALGSTHGGQKLGTFGNTACFSFHETKNIHAGLSGALVINDQSLLERAGYMWERGTNRQAFISGMADKYTWVEVGGSFYPTEFQAAFLLAQLESFNENLTQRRAIFMRYAQRLASLKEKGRCAFPDSNLYDNANCHAFYIILNSAQEREACRVALNDAGIQAVIHYVPLHSSPVGESMGYKAEDLPITEEYANRVLRLPLHNKLQLDDVDYICDELIQFLDKGSAAQ